MLIPKEAGRTFPIENCHDGSGTLHCTEMLAAYRRAGPGFRFIHDNILEPGASIGEHVHDGDEELYLILDGEGVARIDGEEKPVKAGDVIVTRSGHAHALRNSERGPMHLLVICTGL